MAQINLSEVTSSDTIHLLPGEGTLSFFFDVDAFFDSWPGKPSTWRVLYDHHVGADLQRLSLLEGEEKRKHYHPSRVTFSAEMTLPDYSSYDATSLQQLSLSGPLTQEEEEAYYEVQAQLAGTMGAAFHIPLHRLLGYPDNVQWDMHGDLPGSPTDWQLLLQIDSDGVPNTEWGDTGRIYYWIRTQDLLRRDFSRVTLLLQSSYVSLSTSIFLSHFDRLVCLPCTWNIALIVHVFFQVQSSAKDAPDRVARSDIPLVRDYAQ